MSTMTEAVASVGSLSESGALAAQGCMSVRSRSGPQSLAARAEGEILREAGWMTRIHGRPPFRSTQSALFQVVSQR
jgi:hypothetical protein